MEKEPNYSGSNSNEHNAKIILIFPKINGLWQENLRGHFHFCSIFNQSRFRLIKHLKMTDSISVLWKVRGVSGPSMGRGHKVSEFRESNSGVRVHIAKWPGHQRRWIHENTVGKKVARKGKIMKYIIVIWIESEYIKVHYNFKETINSN